MQKLFWFLLIVPVACQEAPKGPVRSYVLPEYPPGLQREYPTQGTLNLTAQIGKDGKVVSVVWPTVPTEGFWGPEKTLVEATHNNLCQWTFEPPTDQEVLPVRHDIEYVFKLEGDPVDNPKTRYLLQLPHRIEIISEKGRPFVGHTLWPPGLFEG